MARPCLSVNFPFASYLTFVYTLIIGLLLTSKPQNMIIILEFPNGKNVNWKEQKNVNDHTYKGSVIFTGRGPLEIFLSFVNF